MKTWRFFASDHLLQVWKDQYSKTKNMSHSPVRVTNVFFPRIIANLARIHWVSSYERLPKPRTTRKQFLYTRTLMLDTIMELSGTIGVTQKNDDFWHTCLPDVWIEDIHPASQYRNDTHFLSFWVLTYTSPQRALKWLPCWQLFHPKRIPVQIPWGFLHFSVPPRIGQVGRKCPARG